MPRINPPDWPAAEYQLLLLRNESYKVVSVLGQVARKLAKYPELSSFRDEAMLFQKEYSRIWSETITQFNKSRSMEEPCFRFSPERMIFLERIAKALKYLRTSLEMLGFARNWAGKISGLEKWSSLVYSKIELVIERFEKLTSDLSIFYIKAKEQVKAEEQVDEFSEDEQAVIRKTDRMMLFASRYCRLGKNYFNLCLSDLGILKSERYAVTTFRNLTEELLERDIERIRSAIWKFIEM